MSKSSKKTLLIICCIFIVSPLVTMSVLVTTYMIYTGYSPIRMIMYFIPIIGFDYLRFDFIRPGMSEDYVNKVLGDNADIVYNWSGDKLICHESAAQTEFVVPYDSVRKNYIITAPGYSPSDVLVEKNKIKKIKVYIGEEPCIYIYFDYHDKVRHRLVIGS